MSETTTLTSALDKLAGIVLGLTMILLGMRAAAGIWLVYALIPSG